MVELNDPQNVVGHEDRIQTILLRGIHHVPVHGGMTIWNGVLLKAFPILFAHDILKRSIDAPVILGRVFFP